MHGFLEIYCKIFFSTKTKNEIWEPGMMVQNIIVATPEPEAGGSHVEG